MAVIAVLGAGAVLYCVDPAASVWMPKCPLHAATGLHCPGCGATRALHALLHGDLRGAFSLNALFVCAAPLVLAASVRRLAGGRESWSRWTTAIPPRWIWMGVAVAAMFAVLRNLPLDPFTLLAPN